MFPTHQGTIVRSTAVFTPPPQTLVPSQKKKKRKEKCKLNFQSIIQLVNKEFTLFVLSETKHKINVFHIFFLNLG